MMVCEIRAAVVEIRRNLRFVLDQDKTKEALDRCFDILAQSYHSLHELEKLCVSHKNCSDSPCIEK